MLDDRFLNSPSDPKVRVVLLDMSHVSVVDVSGLEVMEEQLHGLTKNGKVGIFFGGLHSIRWSPISSSSPVIQVLVLCGLSRQPLRMLSRAGFLDEVGRDNVCRGVEQALKRTEEILLQDEELLLIEGLKSNIMPASLPLLKGSRVATERGDLEEEGASV